MQQSCGFHGPHLAHEKKCDANGADLAVSPKPLPGQAPSAKCVSSPQFYHVHRAHPITVFHIQKGAHGSAAASVAMAAAVAQRVPLAAPLALSHTVSAGPHTGAFLQQQSPPAARCRRPGCD